MIRRKRRRSLRQRKCVTEGVVERIPGRREEPAVPHQRGVKRSVGRGGRPPLVSRTASVLANDVVVLNADGYRLAVAETIGRGMTTTTGVVGVKTAGRVEPQESAQICQRRIQSAPEPHLQARLDLAGEVRGRQYGLELAVQIPLSQ